MLTLEDMQQEIHRLQQRFAKYEMRQQDDEPQEEEKEKLNHFHQENSREEETMLHDFGFVYERKDADQGVEIDLLEFKE